MMLEDMAKILFTEEQIHTRVRELAEEIKRDYEGKNPILIGVLKGAFVFMAELCKNLDIYCETAFVFASSYRGMFTTGKVTTDISNLPSLEGRHVIVVEDILDTGTTLSFLCEELRRQGTASLEICSLLDKPSRRRVELTGKYIGFTIPDEFVVGYGLDYEEQYRNTPYVGVMKPSVYE